MSSCKCFKDGFELVAWEERNCFLCHQGVWYDVENDVMPEYKCSVQEQIDMQEANGSDVDEETYKVSSCEVCPKGEFNEDEVLDFSGNELGCELKYKKPSVDENLERSQRLHAVQVLRDSELFGGDINETRNAEDYKNVGSVVQSKLAQQHPFRITEGNFKSVVRKEIMDKCEKVPFEESMLISYTPVALKQIIWDKVLECTGYCAEKRISETKKLCRAIKELKSSYDRNIRLSLDAEHIRRMGTSTEEWMSDLSRDFQIMYWSCRQQVLDMYEEDSLIDLHTMALECIVLIEFEREHQRRMDDLLTKWLERAPEYLVDRKMIALEEALKAFFQGDVEWKFSKSLEMCKKVFDNNIKKLKFK